MKLLSEEVQDVQFLVEAAKDTGKKSYKIQGIFMQAEHKNRNGRVYPFQVLENEVRRYNDEYVSKDRAVGELGHPDNPSINLDKVCIKITSLTPEGHNFVGSAKVLDTPMGDIVKGLLDGGVSLGVSTRGVGSLKPHNGYQLVQNDFKLATAADVVHDPSAHSAFVQGIMENSSWIYENGLWTQQQLEQAKKTIKVASRNQIEEISMHIFENMISKIKKS